MQECECTCVFVCGWLELLKVLPVIFVACNMVHQKHKLRKQQQPLIIAQFRWRNKSAGKSLLKTFNKCLHKTFRSLRECVFQSFCDAQNGYLTFTIQ